jgi:hypothetical protein
MHKLRLAAVLLCVVSYHGLDMMAKQSSAIAAEEKDKPSAKPASGEAAAMPKVRKFTFNYKFKLKGLKPSDKGEKNLVRVWLPVPPSNDIQSVTRLDATSPAKLSEHNEQNFGNRILYFETAVPALGEFMVDVPYDVVRNEVLRKAPADGEPEPLTEELRKKLLAADQMVPTSGKPLALISKVKLPGDKLELAQKLYNIVDDHVVYKKEGTGWGRGDTNWVCSSGYGNCTDFHSLFMSLARSQGLPARFEMGFSIPTDKTEGTIAGYHCWAWFYLDERGWIPVDISEADKHPEMKKYYFGNLTADRVMFTTGRDLELSPKPAHTPLNFLVYPYIEVGGEVLPKENVELQFSFKDKP